MTRCGTVPLEYAYLVKLHNMIISKLVVLSKKDYDEMSIDESQYLLGLEVERIKEMNRKVRK